MFYINFERIRHLLLLVKGNYARKNLLCTYSVVTEIEVKMLNLFPGFFLSFLLCIAFLLRMRSSRGSI